MRDISKEWKEFTKNTKSIYRIVFEIISNVQMDSNNVLNVEIDSGKVLFTKSTFVETIPDFIMKNFKRYVPELQSVKVYIKSRNVSYASNSNKDIDVTKDPVVQKLLKMFEGTIVSVEDVIVSKKGEKNNEEYR